MKWLSLRLAILVLSVSVAILLAEGLVRLLVPVWLWKYRDATVDWRRDPELGWTQKPNLDVKSRIPGRDWVVRFQTNPDGITPAAARRRRQPGTRRIMIFGNSTVLGRSVPQDRTVTKQLERLLNRRGVKTEVINAGVQGYSTDQVLLHIRRLAPLYRPDVVIYGFCLNDLGGIGLRRAYGLPKPMFVTKAQDRLELLAPELDQSAIPSFGQGPRKWLQFSALYRLLQPQILLVRSHVMSWEERNLGSSGFLVGWPTGSRLLHPADPTSPAVTSEPKRRPRNPQIPYTPVRSWATRKGNKTLINRELSL